MNPLVPLPWMGRGPPLARIGKHLRAQGRDGGHVIDRSAALKVLVNSPLFKEVSEIGLRALLGRGTLRAHRRGSPLFLQDQVDSLLYIVIEGEVLIVSSSAEGETLHHRLIVVSESIGEIAMLGGGPRTAAAIAYSDCAVFEIDRSRFIEFMEANAKVAIRLAQLLARRIRATSDTLESSIFLSAGQRVGRKLQELAETRGRRTDQGWVIDDLTHETLARMVGVHRVSVSNHMKAFEHMGLLKIDRGRVLILALDRLRSLSAC